MWQPQGIYSQFILRSPVILAGKEAARGLCNYPAARIAVIHGNSYKDKELFESIFKKKNIRFIQRSWIGEPDIQGLAGTIQELERFQPDTIIAVGGGSVIDGAKLCRLFYEFPYCKLGVTRLDGDLLKTNFIVIPTTVGSGAEVSSAAVYVDTQSHRKDMVVLHELQPDVIVYDERYVEDSPVSILCASVLDAMAHILEGYVSNVKNDMAEIMAEQGLSILVRELNGLISNLPHNINYSCLQYAGYLGGIVQNHCIAGAAHGMAHQLAEQGFSHGRAVALILPAVIEQNANDSIVRVRYEHISRLAGLEGIDELISFIRIICEIGNISGQRKEIKDLLLSRQDDENFCENVKNDRGSKGNPVEITDQYISNLIWRI